MLQAPVLLLSRLLETRSVGPVASLLPLLLPVLSLRESSMFDADEDGVVVSEEDEDDDESCNS